MTETAPLFNFRIIDPSPLRVSRLMQVDLHRLEEWRQGVRPLSRAKRGRLRLLEAIYAGEDMVAGMRIRRIRQGLKIAQTQVGEWAGVNPHTVSEWERDWDFPTDDQVEEIVAQARLHVEEQAEAFARQPDGPVRGPHQEEAAKVKHLRDYWGLSIKELAARLGVTPSTVERWERGIMKPRQANWNKMYALQRRNQPLQVEPKPSYSRAPVRAGQRNVWRLVAIIVVSLALGGVASLSLQGFGYTQGWW